MECVCNGARRVDIPVPESGTSPEAQGSIACDGLFVVSLALILVATVAHAERGLDTTSSDHPLITAVHIATPPVINGVLDDEAWKVAAQLDDFYVPSLDRKPTERTILWLAYDDTCIYWAGRMYDSHPDQMRMEQTKRGGYVRNDDYISIGFDIDNLHIASGEYVFRMTPRGTQSDDVPDGGAEKVEWRGDWRGAARIDSLGWTVEVAVPMRMFDRPGGPRIVGVSSARWIPRTQERILWPNLGATWDRTKIGDWMHVVFPPQRKPPKLMPYVVGEVTNGSRDGYAGADLKWTTPHGLTLAATAYPDFQNVQNEILGLDFSYTERLRGDNRPFFAEGAGYLPDAWIFYSNRVGEVYGGAKAVGDIGKHRLGIIETYDRQEVNHLAGQWYWQPADRFEITNAFVWRHGRAATVDSAYGPPARDNFMVVSEVMKGHIVRGGTETLRVQGGLAETSGSTGTGWDLEADWTRRPANADFGWTVQGRLLSADFLTIDGLLVPEEADQRDVSASFGYEIEYDRRFLKSWDLWAEAQHATRFDGRLYQRVFSLEGTVELYPGVILTGEIEDKNRPPYHDTTATGMFGWLQDRLFTAGETGVTYGKVEGADYFLAWFNQGLHPLTPLTALLRAEYRRHDFPIGHVKHPAGGIEQRYQLIGTVQYDLTTERAVSGRIVYTRDGLSGCPTRQHLNGYATFQQVVRRGMDLFLIIGDPSADTWSGRVALKAVFVL